MEDVIEASFIAMPELQRPAKLFLAGLSMGGFGALRLGAKYADAVSGISAHSAITHISEMTEFVEEPLSDYTAQSADELDPLYWFKRNRSSLPALRFDCGLDDPLLAGNRRLHQALSEEGIEHTYQEFAGGHEWPYWETHLEQTILFFETELRRLEAQGQAEVNSTFADSPGSRRV
jgi:S-formylglutathione hydrolase FrmB